MAKLIRTGEPPPAARTRKAQRVADSKSAPAVAPVSLLQKGLAIVAALTAEHRPMSLTQIAESSGINTTSALRILRTLIEAGYVLRSPATRLYLPGPRAIFPMDLQHPLMEFRRSALPIAQAIAEDTGLTAGVHLFMYDARLTIEIVKGRKPLTPFYDTQAQRGAHASATGKLFLIAVGEMRSKQILGPGPYPRYTDKTLSDPVGLRRELIEAERLGYARAVEEAYSWLLSVAAPIMAREGAVIGALSVFSMSESLDPQDIPIIGARLARAAEMLGHSCPSLDAIARMLDARDPGSRHSR